MVRYSDVWVNQGSERERADDLLNRGIRGRAGLAWSGGNGDLFVISIWFFVFKFVSSLCKGVTNPVTVVTRAKKSEKKCS